MPVAKYTPRKAPVLYATAWDGREESLRGMPDAQALLEGARFVDGDSGNLALWYGTTYHTVARAGRDYIVRGITGYFFVMDREEFFETYRPLREEEL